jgi:hypothetical protein
MSVTHPNLATPFPGGKVSATDAKNAQESFKSSRIFGPGVEHGIHNARLKKPRSLLPGPRGINGILPSLTLTLMTPTGFVWPDPEENPGRPYFVTWGTAGALIPDIALFKTPVQYIEEESIEYVWAEVGLSTTVIGCVTSLAFVHSVDEDAYPTTPFTSEGVPPDFLYIPLGRVEATGDTPSSLELDVVNSGSGSIVVSVSVTDVSLNAAGTLSVNKNLNFWRTP